MCKKFIKVTIYYYESFKFMFMQQKCMKLQSFGARSATVCIILVAVVKAVTGLSKTTVVYCHTIQNATIRQQATDSKNSLPI